MKLFKIKENYICECEGVLDQKCLSLTFNHLSFA